MKELNIYINDNDLKQIYLTKAKEHNTKIDNSNFMDSGFDILTPNKISICYGKTHKIDFGIICSISISLLNKTSFAIFLLVNTSL